MGVSVDRLQPAFLTDEQFAVAKESQIREEEEIRSYGDTQPQVLNPKGFTSRFSRTIWKALSFGDLPHILSSGIPPGRECEGTINLHNLVAITCFYCSIDFLRLFFSLQDSYVTKQCYRMKDMQVWSAILCNSQRWIVFLLCSLIFKISRIRNIYFYGFAEIMNSALVKKEKTRIGCSSLFLEVPGINWDYY